MKELSMVALPQIRCQLHEHAKQYDNDGACHNKRNGGKLHGNISQNGYGNAIIGRYGGCFEEDIRRLMWDRLVGKDYRSSPTATHKEDNQKINHAPTSSHNGSPYVHATGITNFNTSIL